MHFIINRSDRTGSIIQLMMYAYAYCFKNNIVFNSILTTEKTWWYNEKFFKFIKKKIGINNEIVNINLLQQIDFNDIKNYKNKETSKLMTFFDVSTLCPFFSSNIDLFFDNNFLNHIHTKIEPLEKNRNVKLISIHIRRGDVGPNNKRRYTSDEIYIKLIDNIISNLENYKLHIFSEKKFNGNLDKYKKYKNNISFHLEHNNGFHEYDNIFNDLIFMIHSDYLICSKSSFSYLPALLNKGHNIYHNNKFWNNPLTKSRQWIIYSDDTGCVMNN